MARARHLFGVAMGMDRQAQPAVVAHRQEIVAPRPVSGPRFGSMKCEMSTLWRFC